MTKGAKDLIYDPRSPTRLAPVEDMRIGQLIRRHRYMVDRARKNLFVAQVALSDSESVLAALLEKYPNHDGEA